MGDKSEVTGILKATVNVAPGRSDSRVALGRKRALALASMDRRAVYELLEKPGETIEKGAWLRFGLLALIVLNVVFVILQSVEAIDARFSSFFFWFEAFSAGVFAIEYLARVWASAEGRRYSGRWGRVRYLVSPMAVIDLMALVPSLLSMGTVDLRFLRAARLLRLLRILKIGRYSKTLKRFILVAIETRTEMLLSVLMMALLLLIASGLMYSVEREAQPNVFSSIPAAMWWAIATLTTVGYGDVYPITAIGRVIASFVAVIGIGMFALPSGILCAAFLERIREEKESDEICPHCQKPIKLAVEESRQKERG